MCNECRVSIHRRGFLGLFAAGLAAQALPGRAVAAGATTTVTADEALAKLKAGNLRYVNDPQMCAADLAGARAKVTGVQLPWATIISCSDSRVTPELVFGGLDPGTLFVARNAGNMVDTATMGTLEYGVAALGTPLVVVLGHQNCGAVVAACEVVEKGTAFPGSIGSMLEPILPAAWAMRGSAGDFVENTVRESALRTAKQIREKSPIVSAAAGKVKVVAARYDLATGAVIFLD